MAKQYVAPEAVLEISEDDDWLIFPIEDAADY